MTEENRNNALTASLESINRFIETELRVKQLYIVRLQNDVDTLRKELDEIRLESDSKERQLRHAIQLSEGNKQLINKLLGNISKLQNDIEWYKRTYEQRSFLGTVAEKLFRKRS